MEGGVVGVKKRVYSMEGEENRLVDTLEYRVGECLFGWMDGWMDGVL